MKVTVLTPSIGTEELARCVESVGGQSVTVRHVVVADGKKYHAEVSKKAMKGWVGEGMTPKIYTVPDNTGAGGFYGHRIYANYSQIIDCDYLFLLDEDNTYDRNHVESLLPIAEQYGFAFSRRKIFTKEGVLLGYDNRESTGVADSELGYALVDTSCWCFRKDNLFMLRAIDGGWGMDRVLTQYMISRYGKIYEQCSGLHTMNYFAPDHLIPHFKNIIDY